MKSIKQNFIIKTSYAYINLVYHVYWILIALFVLQSGLSMTNLSRDGKVKVVLLDFFHLFPVAKFDAGFKQSIILSLFITLTNVVLIIVIYRGIKKLHQFFKNVFEEKFFISENGKHLKFVGLTLICISILVQSAEVISTYIGNLITLMGTLEKTLMAIAEILSVVFNPLLILGVFVYAFGEIIIRAAKIKEENDLTI